MITRRTQPRHTRQATTLNPEHVWPLTGLRVRSGDLELRYLDDDLIFELAALAANGIHPADQMPFLFPWSRGSALEVARRVLTYQWDARAHVTPERWTIELAVLKGGQPVGIQAISSSEFNVSRTAGSGSWLGREHQGRGLGTAMRALILHLGFTGFGALEMTTDAWADNAPSNAVSKKIGYRANGYTTKTREGRSMKSLEYVLPREVWLASSAAGAPVEFEGLEGVRGFLELG